MNKEEEVKKMLKERFGNDKLNVKNLDYTSWELGFQRGMEYHRELDKRVLDLEKNAKGVISRFMGNLGGDKNFNI